jgi:endonuclease/exonuclease/phosphatase (EEP) superfamily protein YafD
MMSQLLGRVRPAVLTGAQTLTPQLTATMAPLAAHALWRRRDAMALSATVVGLGGLLLAAPLADARGTVAAPVTAGLRIATVNLLYTNGVAAAVADDLLTRDLDVIAFTEYTAEHRDVLTAHRLATRYPHRIDRQGPRAEGIAVWSRMALDEGTRVPTVNNSVDAVIDAPDGAIRVFAVHTPTPLYDFGEWVQDLAMIRRVAADSGGPTVVIGDLNATFWHPAFRGILAEGYSDALIEVGRGFSASWPIGRRVPPFAQLDHALVGRGLVPTAAANFPIPGSDHRGLVVTVAPAR